MERMEGVKYLHILWKSWRCLCFWLYSAVFRTVSGVHALCEQEFVLTIIISTRPSVPCCHNLTIMISASLSLVGMVLASLTYSGFVLGLSWVAESLKDLEAMSAS